jgi:outer membrane protein assembly factor BamB
MPSPPDLVAAGYLEPLWRHDTPSREPIYASAIGPVPLPAGRRVRPAIVFGGWDGQITALDASAGHVLWRTATGGRCYGRCQAADVDGDGRAEILVPGHDGRITCLDARGEPRWAYANVYDRAGSGRVTRATGATFTDVTKRWAPNAFVRHAGRGEGAIVRIVRGHATGASGEILSNPGGDTLTLAEAWGTVPAPGDIYRIEPRYESDRYFQHAGTLVRGPAGWSLYASGFDNHVVCIDPASGRLRWQYAALENVEAYPLVVRVDGVARVFFGALDGLTRCLDADSGRLVWSAPTGPVDAFLHAADVAGDGRLALLVATRDNRICVLDAASGAIRACSEDAGGDCDCAPVPVRTNDAASLRLVAGSDAGQLLCLDGQARTLWRAGLSEAPVNSSAVVHDVLGRGSLAVLVGDMAGVLHCEDVVSGERVGELRVAGGIEGVPCYGDLDGDGRIELVVTTTAGQVHAWRFARGSLWPSACHPGMSRYSGHLTLE